MKNPALEQGIPEVGIGCGQTISLNPACFLFGIRSGSHSQPTKLRIGENVPTDAGPLHFRFGRTCERQGDGNGRCRFEGFSLRPSRRRVGTILRFAAALMSSSGESSGRSPTGLECVPRIGWRSTRSSPPLPRIGTPQTKQTGSLPNGEPSLVPSDWSGGMRRVERRDARCNSLASAGSPLSWPPVP